MLSYQRIILLFLSAFHISCCLAQTNSIVTTNFIDQLAKEDYQSALNFTDVAFKAKVTPTSLESIWKKLNQAYGAYEGYQAPSPKENANPLTLDVTFKQYIVPLTFHFNVDHEIVGFFVQQTPKLRGSTSRSPALFPEEEVKVKVNGGIISGSLMTPKNPVTGMPVVLIIAGSGPTDRNGNNPYGVNANPYLLLAEALADNGIASFRYDKRLVGESNGFSPEQNKVVFQDFVDDAVYLCQFLSGRKEFGKLFILGHSEGANIGLLASQRVNPAAFISLCGPGENLSSVIETQLLGQPALSAQAKPIIAQLREGKQVDSIPDSLKGLFDPSIQPFIISSFKIEPTEEIKKLHIPVFLIGGTTDLQVPMWHAEKLKATKPDATLLLIQGMNHVLKRAPVNQAANLATYKNPRLPLNRDLVIGLVNFLTAI